MVILFVMALPSALHIFPTALSHPNDSVTMSLTPFLLLLVALVGVGDTLWLTHAHLFGAAACGTGSGCDAVMASSFSRPLGIPLSTLGLGFYLILAGLSWRALIPARRDESIRWVSVLGALAVIPTVVLIYLQAFVIEAWCPFCLLSAALIVSIVLLSMLERRHRSMVQPYLGCLPELHVALPMLLGLVAPSVLFLAIERDLSDPPLTDGPGAATTHVVAHVGDRQITLRELDRAIQLRLSETRSTLRNEWLDLQVLEAVATEKGLDVRGVLQQEVSVPPVDQQQVDRFYELNKARMPAGVSRERLDPQIREQLQREAGQKARSRYILGLRQRFGTELNPPPTERFAIDANPRGGPELGPADAAITIVTFSDLECGYCAQSHRQLDELQRRHSGSIRLVYRHYPLDMHPRARYAAEVAACANRQGEFWPLAEHLFANQKQLEGEKVRGYAQEIGLDMTQLEACLQSGEGRAAVNADVAEGDELGVHSTPTFFINGHYVKRLPSDAGIRALIQRQE